MNQMTDDLNFEIDLDIDLDIDIPVREESQSEKNLKAALLDRHKTIIELNSNVRELEKEYIKEHAVFSVGDKVFIDDKGHVAEYIVKKELNSRKRTVKVIEPKGTTLNVVEVSVMYVNGKSLDTPVIAYVLADKEGIIRKIHYDARDKNDHYIHG